MFSKVKCEDCCGHSRGRDRQMDLCVQGQPDLTVPGLPGLHRGTLGSRGGKKWKSVLPPLQSFLPSPFNSADSSLFMATLFVSFSSTDKWSGYSKRKIIISQTKSLHNFTEVYFQLRRGTLHTTYLIVLGSRDYWGYPASTEPATLHRTDVQAHFGIVSVWIQRFRKMLILLSTLEYKCKF